MWDSLNPVAEGDAMEEKRSAVRVWIVSADLEGRRGLREGGSRVELKLSFSPPSSSKLAAPFQLREPKSFRTGAVRPEEMKETT